MKAYFDTSCILPLFVSDAFSARARNFAAARDLNILISDFVAAEFSSVIALKFRARAYTARTAKAIFADFEAWTFEATNAEQITAPDIQQATSYLQSLDLNLRAPDAIHIAIALRSGATLATFDDRMAECARALGLDVAAI